MKYLSSPLISLAKFQLNPEKVAPLTNVVAWLLSFLAFLCTWTFTSSAATPLLQSDGWYFLDEFVSHWLDGHLTLSDFFVQRGASDHSQPIQKLVLLFHTKNFGMDFRIEGLIGVLFGAAFCMAIVSQMARAESQGWRRVLAPLFVTGIFAMGLSINSVGVYTWPLVTLSFSDLLFAALQVIAFLRLGPKGRYVLLAVITFATAMVTDEIAILALIASVLAAFLGGGWRWKACVRPVVSAIIGLALARLALDWLSHVEGTMGVADPLGFQAFLTSLLRPDAWKLVVLPLVNSVAIIDHLQFWWGASADRAMFFIAAIMVLLHGWFWWNVFRMRWAGRGTTEVGFATALMLLSYAFIAGIAYSRVPVFGWDYLNQPRYVVMYQLSCLAILLMAHAKWIDHAGPRKSVSRMFAVVLLVTTIAIQVPTAKLSYGIVPYLSNYWSRAGLYLGDLANDPAVVPDHCPDIFVLCAYDPEHRAHSLQLLKSHQLNVFNYGFQMRNRIYPSMADIPAPEKKKEP